MPRGPEEPWRGFNKSKSMAQPVQELGGDSRHSVTSSLLLAPRACLVEVRQLWGPLVLPSSVSPVKRGTWVGFVGQDGRKQMLSWRDEGGGQGRNHHQPCVWQSCVPVDCEHVHFRGPAHLTVCDTGMCRTCTSVHLQSVWKSSTLSLGGVDCVLKAVAYGGSGPSRPVSATCCHPRSLKSLAAFCSQGLPSKQ